MSADGQQKLLWKTAFKCFLHHEEDISLQREFIVMLENVWPVFRPELKQILKAEIKNKIQSDNNSRAIYETKLGFWKAREYWEEFLYKVEKGM